MPNTYAATAARSGVVRACGEERTACWISGGELRRLACSGSAARLLAANVSDVLADASDSIERFIFFHDAKSDVREVNCDWSFLTCSGF